MMQYTMFYIWLESKMLHLQNNNTVAYRNVHNGNTNWLANVDRGILTRPHPR